MYENSVPAKLNRNFDKFVKKIGGKKPAILLLLVVFAILISSVAFLTYANQQRQRFDFNNESFSLISIDRRFDHKMVLEDQHGNVLTFSASDSSFEISYLDDTFGVNRRLAGGLEYTFSDGSTGNNLRNQNPWAFSSNPQVFPVGLVPYFTDAQNAESVALATFINFYEDYTEAHVFVLIVIGSIAAWLFVLLGSFFREGFHGFFRPFQRVWQAEWEERRLAKLNGKVSVILLAIEFTIVVILAVAVMNLSWFR